MNIITVYFKAIIPVTFSKIFNRWDHRHLISSLVLCQYKHIFGN